METIYIKRFIKTEADLPKKHGRYDTDEGLVTFDPDDKHHINFWQKSIYWYLQPTTLAELIKEKLPTLTLTYSKHGDQVSDNSDENM